MADLKYTPVPHDYTAFLAGAGTRKGLPRPTMRSSSNTRWQARC
jgi:hypothetical protein